LSIFRISAGDLNSLYPFRSYGFSTRCTPSRAVTGFRFCSRSQQEWDLWIGQTWLLRSLICSSFYVSICEINHWADWNGRWRRRRLWPL